MQQITSSPSSATQCGLSFFAARAGTAASAFASLPPLPLPLPLPLPTPAPAPAAGEGDRSRPRLAEAAEALEDEAAEGVSTTSPVHRAGH
jgi:hypothetical protein